MLLACIAVVLILSLQDLKGTFFKTRYSILGKKLQSLYTCLDGVNTTWLTILHDYSNNKLLSMATLLDISHQF